MNILCVWWHIPDKISIGTGDDEALEPLRLRYNAQHYRLVKFYYECSNLRYLTGLIGLPKLPQVLLIIHIFGILKIDSVHLLGPTKSH